MQIDQYGDQKLNDIPDGLTPPLKNVRNRRFRQTAKKQHDNTPEGKMRRELDELLKRDKEAHNTVFKIENPVETDVATMDDLDAFDTRSVAASATGDLAPGDAAKKAMAAGLNANSSDSDDSDNERGDKDFDAQSVSSFASHNTATTARSQALSGHGHGQGQGQHSKPGSALSIYAQSAASTPPPHATLAEASDRSSPAPTEKSGVSSIASSLKFMSGTPQDAVLDAPTPVKAQAQAQAQAPSTPQLPALGEGMDVALDQGADASPSPAVAPPSPTTIKNQVRVGNGGEGGCRQGCGLVCTRSVWAWPRRPPPPRAAPGSLHRATNQRRARARVRLLNTCKSIPLNGMGSG